MVKNNVCEFSGVIQLVEVKEVEELHYGVDNEFEKSGLKSQGIVIGNYTFFEFDDQTHSGVFEGSIISKWYLNKGNQIAYDDIQSIADGYTNNVFIGSWTNYTNRNSKICRWADYRVPMANNDFDIGAGEFSVSEKYSTKGWKAEILKYSDDENKSKLINTQWWK